MSLHVFADPINPPEALAPPPPGRPTVETGWLDAVRDGIAEEMRRNRNIIYFGEGTGERGGTFAHTKNLYQEFGAGAHGRHADLRARLHRRGARRVGDGRALHRRPHVRRLPVRGGRPDRAAGGEAALHVERPDAGADGDPRRRRRRALGRPAPFRHLPSGLGACPGPHRLPAVDAGRRQGADEDGPAGPRSGHHAGDEGAVRIEGAGAGRRASRAVRRRTHRPRGDRPHHRERRTARRRGRSRPRTSWPRKASRSR